ncbi:MAG: ATP-binding cassette domain-containing protein [Microthrixaceae bacterium]
MDGVLFDFEDVGVTKSDATVLRSVNIRLADHGVTVIVGPSGAGKSTVLRLCNRLDIATTGVVHYRGKDVLSLDPLQLRREVGMVFQRPVLLPGTVEANLREGAPYATAEEIKTALERVGLGGTSTRDASTLSGGEAQRMCLARTLMNTPGYVLFDEPTSSLDPSATAGIEQLALDLAADGMPSAWVTHDLAQMERLAHHLIVVIDGTVEQQGDVGAVLASPTDAVERFLAGGKT